MSYKFMNKVLLAIFLVFTFGFQTSKYKVIDKGIYVVTYSESLKNPVKVTYSVYKFHDNDTVTRKNMNFYSEPGITTASSKDFISNNYDKGHMAPVDQHYQLNRGFGLNWKIKKEMESR